MYGHGMSHPEKPAKKATIIQALGKAGNKPDIGAQIRLADKGAASRRFDEITELLDKAGVPVEAPALVGAHPPPPSKKST